MISLYGLYPRIIEAYFDGNELIIRRTKAYDFSYMNSEGSKTFAQWSLAQANGDTSKDGLVNVAFGGLSVA